MSPVGKNIKILIIGVFLGFFFFNQFDLMYNKLLLHTNMIIDDVNIIRELTDVHENY